MEIVVIFSGKKLKLTRFLLQFQTPCDQQRVLFASKATREHICIYKCWTPNTLTCDTSILLSELWRLCLHTMTMIWSAMNECVHVCMWRATMKQQQNEKKETKENEKQQIMLTSNSCIRLQIQLHRVLGWGPLRTQHSNSYSSSCKSKHSKHRPLFSVHHTCLIITKTFRRHTRSKLKLIRKIAIVCTFIRVRASHHLDVRFSCWHQAIYNADYF